MRLSVTLSVYIARQLLSWLAIMAVGLGCLVFLLSFVEQLRRTSGVAGLAIELAILQLPFLIQKTLPFIILFGSMMAFWRLSRTNELVVARSAGISAWQFLLPAVLMGAAVGGMQTMVFNPLASSLLARYEQVDAEYLRHATSRLSVSPTGVWLRQGSEGGQTVINAQRIAQDGAKLLTVIFFVFENPDRFISRIDADSAELKDGYWLIRNANLSTLDEPRKYVDEYKVDTDLTPDKIADSFASPETLSFWAIPGFLEALEAAGFSGHRHRLYLHSLLAMPLLLGAMVLFAAVFTLKIGTRTSATRTIGTGVICSFLLYFLSDVINAMGLSGGLPAVMAAWSPAALATMLAMAMVFHLEDG
jgi:lipopolysaccharide export system permease protein